MLKKFYIGLLIPALLMAQAVAGAQETGIPVSSESTTVLTLEDALKIALSENVSVKVADKEITRSEYAKKGTYASLFPSIDASASYQRTIKKQVMYMDFDMGDLSGMAEGGDDQAAAALGGGMDMSNGIEVGRWNTYTAGVSAAMPLVNAQLWQSLRIAGQDVELAVEKARSSRLEMVTQVKQAFYSALLAKEAFNVYKSVYENALENFAQTEKRYNVQKASELEYTRAKATVQNAIPNVYDSESSIILALWQLKAVMGIDLDSDIDVAGSLLDFSETMFYEIHKNDDVSLADNSTMRQLAIQAEELANAIKLQKYANLPSLALSFNFAYNAMTNDFKFSEYKWSPYSFIGLSLSVPIFAGGKRHSAIRQASIQYDELELQRKNTERQLQIAVHQYLNQMETCMKNHDAACAAEETARKAYDIAVKSYNLGRSTITELNDAQLALTQAKLGVSQSVYNFVIAKANLEQTLGYDFTEE